MSDKPEYQTVGMMYELNILLVHYNGGKTHQTSRKLVLGILTNDHSSIYNCKKSVTDKTRKESSARVLKPLQGPENRAYLQYNIQYNICIYYSFVVMMVALFEQCIAG